MNTAIPFLILFCVFYLGAWKINFSPVFSRLYALMAARGLAVNQNLQSELTKINLLRIVTGLILFHRTFYSFYYQIYLDFWSIQMLVATFILICAACLIIGFFTPVALALLFLCNVLFDEILSSSTLGTYVLQMVIM